MSRSDRSRTPASPFTLRRLVTGQVLIREGDPSGAVYVVRTGRMRVYRQDLTVANGVVDVASLGAGEVIGELGAMLGRLRSATVQALEPTEVLEIPPDHLSSLVRQHQPLLRVIATALRERTGLSDAEISDLTAKLGPPAPAGRPTKPPAQVQVTQSPFVPLHDSAVAYPKTVDCPSCGSRFSALTVHARKDQPAGRESDFHNTYSSAHNPYDYEVWVCPNDLYAALPVDFPGLGDKHRLQVASAVEEVVAGWGDLLPEFNADRTLDLRQRALELALALYKIREMPDLRLAAITHRLAWCARERGDHDAEQAWLGRAREHYSIAYSDADLGGAQEELRIQYLCGELSLRLGDLNGAVTWFSQALRHPALKEHSNWERMLRERSAVARETRAG
jgi:CRP-like cAMP-binding protein/uncharacterized protein (DUF2225 family)